MAERINIIEQNRLVYQNKIIERHGPDAVKLAREHFCLECQRQQLCFLIPITLDGYTCPYFAERTA